MDGGRCVYQFARQGEPPKTNKAKTEEITSDGSISEVGSDEDLATLDSLNATDAGRN
jgi:hypothetical protein